MPRSTASPKACTKQHRAIPRPLSIWVRGAAHGSGQSLDGNASLGTLWLLMKEYFPTDLFLIVRFREQTLTFRQGNCPRTGLNMSTTRGAKSGHDPTTTM